MGTRRHQALHKQILFDATLLAAADVNGAILDMCELVLQKRGSKDDDPTHGTIDQERFREYIESRVVPWLEKRRAEGERKVVVLDNAAASIHWSEGVIDLSMGPGLG